MTQQQPPSDNDQTIRMADAEVRAYIKSMLEKPCAPAEPQPAAPEPNPAGAPASRPGAELGGLDAEKLGLNPKKITVSLREDSAGECLIMTIRKMLDLGEGQCLVQAVQAVASVEPRKCMIDLAELDFCDSLLQGFCLMAYQATKRLGGSITFQMRQNSFIHKNFDVAKLNKILPVELI